MRGTVALHVYGCGGRFLGVGCVVPMGHQDDLEMCAMARLRPEQAVVARLCISCCSALMNVVGVTEGLQHQAPTAA